MVHIFKYCVLMAIPDRSRGERVNVGIIVFLEDRIDIRISEVSKIRVLTGQDWSQYAKDMTARLIARFSSGVEAQSEIANFPQIDPAFEASELAWFSISSEAEYAPRVQEILNALVVRPKPGKEKVKASRINTEISRHLKKLHLLASQNESLSSHKVIRNFNIEDDLNADFVQMNGVLRVAATLDLRRANTDIRDAALKAIVLDRASETQTGTIVRMAIYASYLPDATNIRSHLNILKEYSDNNQIYNWEDANDKRKFTAFIADGMRPANHLVL